MRGGVAEIGQHTVAEVLRDHATQALDLIGAARLKGADDVALLFRIKPSRECARAHHVAEYDGELAALGRRGRWC